MVSKSWKSIATHEGSDGQSDSLALTERGGQGIF